jgi:hypothetical protein
MRFRCRRCGETTGDSRLLSRHVVTEHGRASLGWDIERVPERGVEYPVAWLSNLPIRVRTRLRSERGSD